MLWCRLPSEESNDTNNRDILGVFRVLVVAAMGCLFGCFRINDGSLPPDSKSHLVSQALAPKIILYLVPRDMSVGQFIHILSGRLHLAPGKALFVFVNNTLPQTTSLIETVYESSKDKDGFLYMCYSSEKTFGHS